MLLIARDARSETTSEKMRTVLNEVECAVTCLVVLTRSISSIRRDALTTSRGYRIVLRVARLVKRGSCSKLRLIERVR